MKTNATGAVLLSLFLNLAFNVPAASPVERFPTAIQYEKPTAETVTNTATGRLTRPNARPQVVQWVTIFSGMPEEVRRKLAGGGGGLAGHMQEIADRIQGATSELKEFARTVTSETFGPNTSSRGTNEYYSNESAANASALEYEKKEFRLKKTVELKIGDMKITGRLYGRERYAPEDVLGEATCKVVIVCDPTINPEGKISLHMSVSVGEALPKAGVAAGNEAALRAFKDTVQTEVKQMVERSNAKTYDLDEEDKGKIGKGEVVHRNKTYTHRGSNFRMDRTVIPISARGKLIRQSHEHVGDWDEQWGNK